MDVTINAKDLFTMLVGVLNEVKTLELRVGRNQSSLAIINAKREILERLIVFIHKSIKEGEIDMGKLTLEFKKETVSLEELLAHRKEGVIEPKIEEIAENLKPGQAKPVESGTISWGHFSSRVYSMVEKGTLSAEYAPLKRGETFFLVRFNSEQMKTRRKKRSKIGA